MAFREHAKRHFGRSPQTSWWWPAGGCQSDGGGGMRVLPRALAGGTAAVGAAAAAAYYDDGWRRSLLIGGMGSFCRFLIRGTNQLTVHDAHHLEQGLQRPAGTALLSVSNHIATVDDPHLLASIVPLRTLANANQMRWGVCGDDVCFRPGTMLCRLSDAAKVLPIKRGGGVWQPELDAIIEKLRAGDWCAPHTHSHAHLLPCRLVCSLQPCPLPRARSQGALLSRG